MATTRQIKKTTTAAENTETIKESPVKTKRKFEPEDLIPCRSITGGELGMIGIKTGIDYTWFGLGEVVDVEYQDLAAAVRSGKKFVTLPTFIIMDDDFIEEFPQIKKMYEGMYSKDDLMEIFDLPVAQMKSAIEHLPKGAKESVKHLASTAISEGKLDSVQKIKVLDEIYDTELALMAGLFTK